MIQDIDTTPVFQLGHGWKHDWDQFNESMILEAQSGGMIFQNYKEKSTDSRF